MQHVQRDPLFVALTRPQMLFGVPYSLVILNGVITTELFLVFKSIWVLIPALLLHFIFWATSFSDSRILELWITKARHCPKVPNFHIWRCNSYQP